LRGPIHVLHFEGNVAKSFPVGRHGRFFCIPGVLVYFQGWAVLSMSRQAQMNSGKPGVRHAGRLFQPLARQIPFRRNGHAAENFLIKLR
jgi:hypothetical protein